MWPHPNFSACFCICRSMTIPSSISLARNGISQSLKLLPLPQAISPIPIAQNIQHIHLSNSELDAILGSVECNPVYSTIYHLTLKGLADCRQQVPCIARHFWGAWDELSIESGLLLREIKVCIPPELLNCPLADLHGEHQGIDRMHAQA